jgi:hypothetical protein
LCPVLGRVPTVPLTDIWFESVLYQRGIYPPEDFKVVKKYGLNVLVTTDDEVKNYMKRIMMQLSRNIPFQLNAIQLIVFLLFRLDEGWENLQIGHGNFVKGYWGSSRTLAI